MRIYKNLIFFFTLLLLINDAHSQGTANLFLQKADKAYRSMQYANAAIYYEKYLSEPKKTENTSRVNAVLLAIADSYWNMRDFNHASFWYKRLPSSITNLSTLVRYRTAELLAKEEKYDEASNLLSTLPDFKLRAKGFLETDEMKTDSADWKIKYLDLNTPYYKEFSPLILKNMFLWTTNEPQKNLRRGVMGWDGKSVTHIESFLDTSFIKVVDVSSNRGIDTGGISKQSAYAEHFSLSDKSLLAVVRLPSALIEKRKNDENLSTPLGGLQKYNYNVANPSYNLTNNKIYFSINNQDRVKTNDVRMVGIAEANIDGNTLTDVSFLPLANSEYSVMHPAIHPNSTTLIYSSNQLGGKGGFDLYYVNRASDSTWTQPQPLSSLNTVGNELFSGFSPTGELFFSSDGQPGLGGLDIYKAILNENMVVKSLDHLPYPVNTQFDEFGFTQIQSGKKGYFSTDRYGEDDILEFEYDMKVVNVKGYVVSRLTHNRKSGVKLILQKKSKNNILDVIESSLTDANGDFSLHARPNYDYVLKVDNGGDDVQEIGFTTKNIFDVKSLEVIYVDKEKVVEVVVPELKKDTVSFITYFAYDKSHLTVKAKMILKQAASLLAKDPSAKLVIGGHTDQRGTDEYNNELSEERETAVRNYLLSIGVERARLEAYYYGESRPVIITNEFKKAAKNRRVEIQVIK